VVLAVYLLFSVACFLTVHEHKMRVYFLVGAGGFARTAVRAASRLWSAPGAPFTPAWIESPAGTILEKARI